MSFEEVEMGGGGEEIQVKVLSDVTEFNPLALAVVKLSDARAKVKELGPRPDPVDVEEARKAILRIQDALQDQVGEVYAAPCPPGHDLERWQSSQTEKVKALEESAAKAREPYEALLELEELHILYEEEVKQAELAVEGMEEEPSASNVEAEEEVDEYVSSKLQEALENQLDTLDLSSQFLSYVPESFGRISSLVILNLSNNRLEFLPDSIAGLVNLEVLDLQHNQLKLLPDSIGLLSKLKSLDVSGNALRVLPASLGRCSALVEFIANFNQLEVWPSDFGFQLNNLQTLSLHLNKISSLPPSIGELRALRFLDVHFNKLRGLPSTIGNLSNLTVLDVSSNFRDFAALPDSVGDLVSLTEMDLSFNQIHELPISMGRLTNLRKLKLEENPLMVPPMEVVEQGHEALMQYMAKLWSESLKTEEEKNLAKSSSFGRAFQGNGSTEGWIPAWAGGSLVNSWLGKVQAGGLGSLLGGGKPSSPRAKTQSTDDSYLDQEL
ncbi:hypothetical protein M758_4G137400 [Ceratodon purpureus]|uniref:Disease resistance R13L4/SHOC-2-like LRR domain-containing protein n=1 Tax=Ceratodon purpureus TaxID=3225 RepID=A0A8T0IAK2_CERPU|nr:hypothetical protein KC19_4G136100 [Ceratodon purpureus]KAG0619404.1 hypothetical protein M758_4G137400 [Ceratodon purpureus]